MRQLTRRLFTAFSILRHRGVGYIGYLFTGYWIPKVSYTVLSKVPAYRLKLAALAGLSIMLVIIAFSILYFMDFVQAAVILAAGGLFVVGAALLWKTAGESRKLRLARDLYRRARAGYGPDTFTRWSQVAVSEETRQAVETARKGNPDGELVIGRIDHDIRVLGVYGDLPILPPVKESEFIRRPRFELDVVLVGDRVLVRKDFRGDRKNFLNEWLNLMLLHGKANVPAIDRVDEKGTVLYKNLVLGRIVRDVLLDAGARIMSVQFKDDPELAGLSNAERLAMVVERGSELIPTCIPESFLVEMEHQINIMHACGLTGVTPTFGNVIIEAASGAPYFIDFEGAKWSPSQDMLFHYHRDRDREKFNQRFRRRVHTESIARQELAAQITKLKNWYAPIDFGRGMAIDGFWSIGSGTGRWDVIRHAVTPHIQNAEILDLGSNNGIMPIMMLRAGARKVTGLELSPEFFEAAHQIHRIFEWRDIRHYDFKLLNCNMLEILQDNWERFDAVTAFCSLYYLTEGEMARVVRRAAELAPMMILQANTATRAEAAHEKSKKASLEFMDQLLKENGFPKVEVFAPEGYNRPVLIGRKA